MLRASTISPGPAQLLSPRPGPYCFFQLSSGHSQLPSPSSGDGKCPGCSLWLLGTPNVPASSAPENSQACNVLTHASVFMGRMMLHSTVHGIASLAPHTTCTGGETSDTPNTQSGDTPSPALLPPTESRTLPWDPHQCPFWDAPPYSATSSL